jgi:hypothetical protein
MFVTFISEKQYLEFKTRPNSVRKNVKMSRLKFAVIRYVVGPSLMCPICISDLSNYRLWSAC